jgi:hypothetical protein
MASPAAVNALTEFKQRIAPLKRDPAPDHWRVYDAIAAKDAEGARVAMTELIRLAIMDTPIKQRPKPAKQSACDRATLTTRRKFVSVRALRLAGFHR